MHSLLALYIAIKIIKVIGTFEIISWGEDKNFLWMFWIAIKCFVPFSFKYVLSKKDKTIFLESIQEMKKFKSINIEVLKRKFGI